MEGRSYSKEYGNRCRQIRMAKGLSQVALAEKMNTTPQNVSKWERDGVSNVDTVMQLSEVLGQDITADEIDQEGTVGEVGKEILSILAKNKGYYEFESLVGDLYGLPKDRVSNEIFKLERIGNVVREQYKDWLNNDRDGVFITAKGIITLKNSSMFPSTADIQGAVAYEKRIRGYINFNDSIQKDELSQLIWKLPDTHTSYRACYRDYLIHHFRESFPNSNVLGGELFYENFIPGVNCYFDTIYCMALGYDNRDFELTEEEEKEACQCEIQDWEEEQRIMKRAIEEGAVVPDPAVINAQKLFEKIFPWIGSRLSDIYEKNKAIKKKVYESIIDEVTEEEIILGSMEPWEPKFRLIVGEKAEELCDKWFTDEQILEFINKNYKSAETEREHRIDDIIQKIYKLNPETMDYYYSFPESWEESGMAQKIRDVWGLPTIEGWRDLLDRYYEEPEED